jgi:hypothetical protein
LASRFDPRAHGYDDHGPRGAGMIYVLMLVVALAFGGFVWQLYSGAPDVPRIVAPAEPYKVAPPPEAANAPDAVEQSAFGAATETGAAAPPSAAAEEAPPAAGPPQLAAAPHFVANGPYVAQLAALQSEQAADLAWRRFASRAPDLFAPARLDLERADLGARGVYYRVRAGYFADRAGAARFCARIRQMGQDCIVAAR